jgi:hypothetical protein
VRLFVTSSGYGRSGTTWMQRYLNTFGPVVCHGQPTVLPVELLHSLYLKARLQNASSKVANIPYVGMGYEHHIAASDAQILAGLRLMAEVIWFPEIQRKDRNGRVLGIKNNTLPLYGFMRQLFPQSKFVCCIRNPWPQYVSLVSSHVPTLAWSDFIDTWGRCVKGALEGSDVFCFQIDRKDAGVFDELDGFLGLERTEAGAAMIRADEKIHAAPTDYTVPEFNQSGFFVPDDVLEMAEGLGYTLAAKTHETTSDAGVG